MRSIIADEEGGSIVQCAVASIEVESAGCGGTQKRENVGTQKRENVGGCARKGDALSVAAVPREGKTWDLRQENTKGKR